MYFAVIGDMVGSRLLFPAQRSRAQEQLFEALDKLNTEYSEYIAADFLITLGDECQGLLTAETNPVSIAMELMRAMYPFNMRFAIGVGEITTRINREAALGADGPAFHNARDAMECMKHMRGARLRVRTGVKRTDSMLNTIAALLDAISADWTDKQAEAASIMLMSRMRGERLTQKELADRLNITQSTVNSALSAAHYREYSEGIFLLRDELKRFVKGEI